MSLVKLLWNTPEKQLNKVLKSSKQWFHFKATIYTFGIVIYVKCTDIRPYINFDTWNGYDTFFENDETTKFYIEQVLKERNLFLKK